VKSRDLAGSLQLLRPRLRRLLPQRLHHHAGHIGRWAVRAMEGRGPAAAVGLPATLPRGKGLPSAHHGTQVVLASASLMAGGAERQIVNLMKGLRARGQRAVLLTLDLCERAELRFFLDELEVSGIEVRNAVAVTAATADLAESCGTAAVDAFRASLAWAPADIRDDILRMAGELHRIEPAVVHGWQDATGIVAAFAALATGSPRIVVGGRNLHPGHFSHSRPYMRAALGFLAARPEVVLTNNSAAGACSYAEWLGLPIDAIPIVRNGIAREALTRPAAAEIAAFRQKLGVPTGCPLVGGVFRLQAEKRPLLWLDVASRVSRAFPQAHFVILGDGTMRGQMQKAAARLGLGERLVMPGNLDDARLALATFDVMLLTSKQEGTPNVVLEAACQGVPVVATDAGGTSEAILEGVTGLIVREHGVPVGDLAGALAEAVVRTLAGELPHEGVRRCGPAMIARSFSLERMIDEMMVLYRRRSV
jgi:glycosyltransferase involved in cell wall biosynthesis